MSSLCGICQMEEKILNRQLRKDTRPSPTTRTRGSRIYDSNLGLRLRVWPALSKTASRTVVAEGNDPS